ncbi:MAG: T9SS type A sorting domain-containing protein, partial [Saprospiraceae bacterium]
RFVSVRYRDAEGVYRICCLAFYLCDPSDCDAVAIDYNVGTTSFDFTFTPNGTVTDIVWINDETGAVIATDVLSVSLPFDGDCRTRQITVRYKDENGVLRICCPTYFYCDPYECGDIIITILGGNEFYTLFFEPAGPATNIVWVNDATGAILATDIDNVVIQFDEECNDRFISVRYYDANGVYHICCITFIACVLCEEPQPSFTSSLTENILTVQNTTPGGSDNTYLWNFGGVSTSTDQDPAPVTLTPGSTTTVCLTATNDCGNEQTCTDIVVPDPDNDLTFDLDDDVCAPAGQIVQIPVYVRNFNDILNFQFSIEMADLTYGSIVGFDFGMLPPEIVTPTGFLAGPGSATVVWADNEGENLPDDFVFMTVSVQLADLPAGETPIVFTGSPTPVYAEKGNGDEVVPLLLAGSVNICRLIDIEGNIRTEDGDGIGQVEVFLDRNGSFLEMTTTDAGGNYAFTDLDADQNYIVRPVKDINYLNGVNAGDLTRISDHILSQTLLSGPYKRIAADVRPPNTINSGDLSRIRQLILGDVATFSDVDSWRFVVAGHTFPDPDQPTATAFPETAVLNSLQTSSITQDFVGVKMGDVNNSNDPQNLLDTPVAEERGNDDLTFAFQTLEVPTPGTVFTVDVTARAFTDMIAAQLSMSWDPAALEFVQLNNLNTDLDLGAQNFSFASAAAGRLPWVWYATDGARTLPDSTVLFSLEFNVLAGNGTQTILSFGGAPTVPFFEDLQMELNPQYDQYVITVGESPVSVTEETVLGGWSIYPNPAKDVFFLSQVGPAANALERIELYGINGRLLRSWDTPADEARFDLGPLPSAVYLVRLVDGVDSRVIRLLVR